MQITFLGLLALLFIGLKLAGIITWSWWLVTLPLWAGLLIAFIVFLLIVIGVIAKAIIG